MRHGDLLQGMAQNDWAEWNFNNLAPQLSLLFTYVLTDEDESCLYFFWVIPRERSLLLMSDSLQCAWSCCSLYPLLAFIHIYLPSSFFFPTSVLGSLSPSSECLLWVNVTQVSSSNNVWDTAPITHFHMVIYYILYMTSLFYTPTTLLEIVLIFLNLWNITLIHGNVFSIKLILLAINRYFYNLIF